MGDRQVQQAGSTPGPEGEGSRVTGGTSDLSSWEYAGNQDELLQLRAGLNEKELELIELREQHVQLAARSQEARTNWEAALTSKDRAIAQLEEALASRQRAIEQLIAATSSTEQLNTELQDKDAQIQALEHVLAEAKQKLTALKQTNNEQKQLISSLQVQANVSSADEQRIEQLQQQLTQAFQGELQTAQQRATQAEDTANTLSTENQGLRQALAEREQQVADLGAKHQELKQQVLDLRDHVLGAEQKLARQGDGNGAPSSKDGGQSGDRPGSEGSQREQAGPSRGAGDDSAAAASSAAAAAQQAASASQVLELQQQMLTMAMKLQAREFQARRYKEAVRALKARYGEAEAQVAQRDAQITRMQASAPSQDQLSQHQQELQDRDRITRKMLLDLEDLEKEKQAALLKCEAFQRRCEDAESTATKLQAQLQAALDQLKSVQPSWQQHRPSPAGALQVACIGNNSTGLPTDTSVGELTILRHRCLDAEQRLQGEEERCVEAVRQLEAAKQKTLEAQRYADEARRRVLAMEVRNDDSERSLSEARRALERQEQRAELAERAVRGLELQVVDADRRAKQAELLCSNAEQRLRETEGRSGDAARAARGEALRAADAEARMKAAEAQQATAERQTADAEARLRESERRLRDVERQLSELSCRWRESDRERQSLDTVLHSAETLARQARTDCDAELHHMQQVAETWKEAMSRDLEELRLALEQALSAKGMAELQVTELEAQLSRQERRAAVTRSDADDMVRSVLESRLRIFEQSLATKDCTIAQLQAAVSEAQAEGCQAMQSLTCELEAKSLALADAEMRFTELEALMQRIIGRTSMHIAHEPTAGSCYY